MAKKKILKSTQTKLAKAAAALKSFSSGIVSGNTIILSDLYIVADSGNNVTFTLSFNNIGSAASTDVFLNNQLSQGKLKDSVINFPLGTNDAVSGKFMKLFSTVAVTNLTPLPDKLKAEFSISGGTAPKSYPLPDFTFNAAGDKASLDISIFFLHV